MSEERQHRPQVVVVETASGLAPEEEAQFMQQRSAAASATVSDAFKAEVDQLNKDYTEKKISKTDLIQKKLNAVETHLG